mgnify:CR=1 FL=1
MTPLGIDPTIDYVFRKIFGDPKNSDVLIHVLNSVLEFRSPITEVEILNPFVDKEFEDDKLAILDIKARDVQGRWFNVEMQTTVPAAMRERLVYYAGCLFVDQLTEGVHYSELRPVISICFSSVIMFRQVSAGHLRFSLSDIQHGVELTDHFQIHTVELPKYNLDEVTVGTGTKLSQWAYLLRMAPRMEADRLRELLTETAFQKAIGVLEMISRTPEQRQIYDARQKAIRDFESAIEGARFQGREEGQQIGQIRLLQQLLHDPISDESELVAMPLGELIEMAQRLQIRLTQRSGQ